MCNTAVLNLMNCMNTTSSRLLIFLAVLQCLFSTQVSAQNEPKGQPANPATGKQPTNQQPATNSNGSGAEDRNPATTSKVTPKSNDYSNLEVDNMSDAQVRQMMQRMGESGMTEKQLEAAAAARGMSSTEIQKLKDRARQLNGQQPDKEESTEQEESEDEEVKKARLANEKGPPKSRIFGAALFSSGASPFETNTRMATPKNYVVGPDDELLIDLTGDNEASYRPRVSPEGFISLEYVGKINVAGLTIEQAASKIRSQMAGVYPGLRTGRTNLSINLGNIRSIRVIMSGEVTKPGTYTISSLASVFNALYLAGGPNEKGSFRNIQVIRGSRVVATIDLYDFLINGVPADNVRLEDQDIIHIPIYQIRVDVLGEVKRSAIYEIRPTESLADVLRYAGGFSDMAYKARVKIVQNTEDAQKIVVKQLLEYPDFYPKNGDKVFVDPIFERFENKVDIAGPVARPGMYEFKPGMTISQLVILADSLSGDTFKERGYIIRTNADNTTTILPFNVADVMSGGNADLPLQKNDIVNISSVFDLRDGYNVTINGEVRSGGNFNFSENMKVEDLVQMAGGFKLGANPLNIEVARRVMGADMTQKDVKVAQVFHTTVDKNLVIKDTGFVLQPYDVVTVRPIEGFPAIQQVFIGGEVLRPGYYTVEAKNERISDLVKRAGGFTAFAYVEGASLNRGEAAVLPGDPVTAIGIDLKNIMANPVSRQDLLLKNGDVINVPSLLQTVKVTGQVQQPINVVYTPGKTFKHYINSAGGFADNALKRNSYISHPNGAIKGVKKVILFNNYPEVRPGSVIAVPQKPVREKLSAQAWIGLGTGVASLAALIFAILK